MLAPNENAAKPPACPRCDGPMTLHSVQPVEDRNVNVFECKDCGRLKAIEVPKAA